MITLLAGAYSNPVGLIITEPGRILLSASFPSLTAAVAAILLAAHCEQCITD